MLHLSLGFLAGIWSCIDHAYHTHGFLDDIHAGATIWGACALKLDVGMPFAVSVVFGFGMVVFCGGCFLCCLHVQLVFSGFVSAP